MKVCHKCGDEYEGKHNTRCDECLAEAIKLMEKIQEERKAAGK